MTPSLENHLFRLMKRPVGEPTRADFSFDVEPVAAPGPGQLLIKNLYLSLDPDRGIQTLLREVQSDQLAVALRGAEPEVQDKVFRNMSKRAAEILKDDMEARGPVKVSEVEAAQKEIIAAALKLAGEGTIIVGGRGGGGEGGYV